MRRAIAAATRAGHRILIIGEYLDQLQQIAEGQAVTGKTHSGAITYEQFRSGASPD